MNLQNVCCKMAAIFYRPQFDNHEGALSSLYLSIKWNDIILMDIVSLNSLVMIYHN